MQLICVYGYSMSIFVPITAVLFIDSSLVQTILLIVGFSWSVVFLVRGILSMDKSMKDRERMILGVFIMAIQVLLVIMYKYYFFHLI